jgi:FMN phosphatase YigB (HAD superfamily)
MLSAPRHVATALVLDIDGVVLHAPRALGRVAQRATEYVQRELGLTDRRYAKRVNKLLYSQHGHTLIGLRKVFGAPLTNRHFAEAVYGADTLATLAEEAATHPEIARRFQDVRGVLLRAQERDVPVYLFSNAPETWTRKVYDLGKLSGFLPASRVISSDHPVFAGSLKPDPLVYENMEDLLREDRAGNGRAGDALRVLFADDSYTNLIPTMNRQAWTNVYFNPKGPTIGTPRLTTVKRMVEVGNLI